MPSHPLPSADTFNEFSLLCLNGSGRFVRVGIDKEEFSDGIEVLPDQLPAYLKEKVVFPPHVTDVFVWVHGWRNTHADAISSGRRLFSGVKSVWEARATAYPRLQPFVPAFLLVRWPSNSGGGLFSTGYTQMRDRAAALIERGDAEFFLASLLGYLDQKKHRQGAAGSKTLAASGGFYVHCIGHSFGGRFLTAAIGAAATPQARTLSLLGQVQASNRKTLSAPSANGFQFTVDSALIYQMAAPDTAFGSKLSDLIQKAPFRGPLVLTYSKHDTANCFWHRRAEGEDAIGCSGAAEPAASIGGISLSKLTHVYTPQEFSTPIVNVNANNVYSDTGPAAGAHSDIWYEESVHLLLSLVNHLRA